MTATETVPVPLTDTWATEIAHLRSRYKTVHEPILAALNLLLQDANISDEDAKSRAATRGVRITAASINGARNLLAKRDGQEAAATPTVPDAAPATAAAPVRAARRVRAADGNVDAAAMIQQVVAKLQQQGSVETERLKDAIRKAIQVLTVAVGA